MSIDLLGPLIPVNPRAHLTPNRQGPLQQVSGNGASLANYCCELGQENYQPRHLLTYGVSLETRVFPLAPLRQWHPVRIMSAPDTTSGIQDSTEFRRCTRPTAIR